MYSPIQNFVWGNGNKIGFVIPEQYRLINITFNNLNNKRNFFTDTVMKENTLSYSLSGASYTNSQVSDGNYPIGLKEGGNYTSFQYLVPVNGNAGGNDGVNRQITTITLSMSIKDGLTLPPIETLSINGKMLRNPPERSVRFYTKTMLIVIQDTKGLFFSDNTPVTFLNCKYDLVINFRDTK